jgi:hypothetical protein
VYVPLVWFEFRFVGFFLVGFGLALGRFVLDSLVN